MNIFKKIAAKNFSFRAISRVAIVTFVVGVAFGAYTTFVAVPKVLVAWDEINNWLTSTETYVFATTTEPIVVNNSELDRYYEEEYNKLAAKYEQARKDEAMLNAMGRLEAEFEKEKEVIRERALF
jgi:hypothetical protein